MASARIVDFSDLELLWVVADLSDNDGWARTADIAYRLFPSANGTAPYAKRCVATRFAWMRRYGFVDRHDSESAWRLTQAGNAFRRAQIDERQFDRLSTSELLPLATWLTKQYRAVDPVAAVALRRAWINGTAPRL